MNHRTSGSFQCKKETNEGEEGGYLQLRHLSFSNENPIRPTQKRFLNFITAKNVVKNGRMYFVPQDKNF